MRSRRLLAFVVLAMLACARPAHAGWLDIIWELTGPRMIGIGGECEVGIARNPDKRCILPLGRFPRFKPGDPPPQDHWFFFSNEAFYYFSAGNGFNTGEVQAFGVDPMVLLSRTKANNNPAKTIRVTSGGGLSFQRFWGKDFNAVANTGLKFRPVAVEFPLGFHSFRMGVAYNIRYYWDGFESTPAVEATPTAPRIPTVFRKVDQPETVHGFVVTIFF